MNEMKVAKVAIIGAGPAGIAAALQLKRYGISPLLFEKSQIGGLVLNAGRVDNYPGFPRGVSGPKLASLFRLQLAGMLVEVKTVEVTQLDFTGSEFRLFSGDQDCFSEMVLLASGTKAVMPEEFSAAPELDGKLLSEIWSLRPERNKKIAVIGAGDAAFDYALSLAQNNELVILNRGAGRKCSPELWRQASRSSRIHYLENARLVKIGPGKQGAVVLDFHQQAEKKVLEVDFAVAACGREKQLDCLTANLSRLRTELERSGLLYFAGDVANGSFRQVGIAVGDGIRAAMKMVKKISEAEL